MIDPLSDVIAMLQPRAVHTRRISGAGRWAVAYGEFGHPSFCIVLDGSCRLAVNGHRALTIQAGDFVLMPATPGFTISGFDSVRAVRMDPQASAARVGEMRYGTPRGKADVIMLGGWFEFESPNAALLVSLLPSLVHLRDSERLAMLVRLIGDESAERLAGRELMLTRLVEALLIEALRAKPDEEAPPGLLRGLADAQLARALRQMHSHIARSWTVAQLASAAALSRSAFYERFTAMVGVPPMEYLTQWRMTVARDLLRHQELDVSEVAQRVGYGSTSAFSVAFSRCVGQSPSRYAAGRQADQPN
ncbi:MAG: AraC family transcriptional regulator [Gemmatimonadaceae bacterium]|nr:AraC family transcriptional regulator [Gemmatimonadaceae bacterium]